jgi:NAD(P)-dependent dehydrogenase (short-subunit alcohol dehydrogenase family)
VVALDDHDRSQRDSTDSRSRTVGNMLPGTRAAPRDGEGQPMSKLQDKVVVITGASSGIGRATALQLVERGCAVVLASRRLEVLEDIAHECELAGGRAIAVQADVTREEDMHRVARAALERWHRLDVWINNAGVTLYALLEEGPMEHHRRVIETNLLGCIHGARAAIPIFRRQHRGVLINVGSILSQVGQAFVPSYVISKFGVQGLSEALRVELADERDIHVCSVFPYTVDTPHFQHAANLMGVPPHPLQPIQAPEAVARAIVRLVEHPRRVRHIPRIATLGLAFHALFPRTSERLLLDTLRRWHFARGTQRTGEGNLYTPDGEKSTVHGDRKPLNSTTTLMAWVAVHLGGLIARGLGGRIRRIARRLTPQVRRDEIAAPA